MSLESNQLVKAVKTAAVDAVKAMKPFSFMYGTVTSVSPLKVEVDQKLILTSEQLILTNAVRDFSVSVITEQSADNETKYTFHFALSVGEKVILLRCDGGQRFIILDRTEAMD